MLRDVKLFTVSFPTQHYHISNVELSLKACIKSPAWYLDYNTKIIDLVDPSVPQGIFRINTARQD